MKISPISGFIEKFEIISIFSVKIWQLTISNIFQDSPFFWLCFHFKHSTQNKWEKLGSHLVFFYKDLALSSILTNHEIPYCRRDIAKRSDKRISAMSEILQGIRVVKMYAWEEAFSRVIGKLRAYVHSLVFFTNSIFLLQIRYGDGARTCDQPCDGM